ncbi:MarR family winged helix-turn-helix transcriptional regulator [Arthrobacter sp. NPDC090010]|uniref:MarR family winged helix-turn-helix transcriptional regulator n=1 Tax=Arthrobacter sp. NPDC090010 TaxID=3363942 RepID=UPI003813C390
MPPTPVPDHDEQAALAASELRNVISRLARKLRQPDGLGALSGAQKNVLSLLERGGPENISELARREGVRPQSMGATVASLEEAGLVQRQPSSEDRRKTLLSLTPRAHELYANGRAFRQDWLKNALGQELGSEELALIRQAVTLLSRITPTD